MQTFHNAATTPNEELELLDGCRSGALPAYERLYQMHGGRMKSIALNQLGNVSDAEDAVQEAFLKIYRGVGYFKGQSAFSTWIYRILINSCYDIKRQRKRRQEISDPEWSADELRHPVVDGGNHPLRLTLEKSLARLSHRHRTVFLLFEVEGFRHSEVAEILEISEGSSKSLLFDAKQKLRRLLGEASRSARATAS